MRILRGVVACAVVSGAAFLIYARAPEPADVAAPDDAALPAPAAAAAPGARPQRIAFDDLDLSKLIGIDELPADVADRLPASIRELEGRQVVLRGFMKQARSMEANPEFTFVRDMGMCCAGPVAKLYHAVQVRLPPGKTTPYIEFRPFDVAGRFRIEVLQLDDGTFMQLYCLDDAEIPAR